MTQQDARQADDPPVTVQDGVWSAATACVLLRIQQFRGECLKWSPTTTYLHEGLGLSLIMALWWQQNYEKYSPVLFNAVHRGIAAPEGIDSTLQHALDRLRVGDFLPLVVHRGMIAVDGDGVDMIISTWREHSD